MIFSCRNCRYSFKSIVFILNCRGNFFGSVFYIYSKLAAKRIDRIIIWVNNLVSYLSMVVTAPCKNSMVKRLFLTAEKSHGMDFSRRNRDSVLNIRAAAVLGAGGTHDNTHRSKLLGGVCDFRLVKSFTKLCLVVCAP